MVATAEEIVGFWHEAGPDRWFTKDPAFDKAFHDRFLDSHVAAAKRELDDWLETPNGALALILLLDQFPRNCFRGTGHMYATDPLARRFAKLALAAGHDVVMDEAMRGFLYLPFGHSEDLADQDRSVELCSMMSGDYEKYASRHRDIIVRFGRFPHRNPMLGRETTPEEQEFLDGGGFAG
jgi:uncharacterized protein (DUF924 family)